MMGCSNDAITGDAMDQTNLRRIYEQCLGLSDVERRRLCLLLRDSLVNDPVASLPTGCVAAILARLPLATMARAVRVSRLWAAAILTDGHWRRMLEQRPVSWLGRQRHDWQRGGHGAIRALLRHEAALGRRWLQAPPRGLVLACHGSSTITSLQLDEAGDRVILGSEDHAISVWRASTGECLGLLQGHAGGVWALSRVFELGEACLLVSGGTDRSLIIWSLSTGQVLHRLVGHTSTVRCVEVALGGRVVVSGSRDGTVRVWCCLSGRPLACLQGHTASVRCLAIFRDRWAISGSYDGSLRVWDLTSVSGSEGSVSLLQPVHVLQPGGVAAKIFSVACSDAHVYAGDAEGGLTVWDPLAGRLIEDRRHLRSLVGHVVVRGDGPVLTGSIDGWLRAWSTQQAEQENQASFNLEAKGRPLFAIQLHPAIVSLDYNQQVIAAATEHGVSLLERTTGRLIHESILPEEADIVWRVSLSSHQVAVAYLQRGASRLALFNYGPTCT